MPQRQNDENQINSLSTLDKLHLIKKAIPIKEAILGRLKWSLCLQLAKQINPCEA